MNDSKTLSIIRGDKAFLRKIPIVFAIVSFKPRREVKKEIIPLFKRASRICFFEQIVPIFLKIL